MGLFNKKDSAKADETKEVKETLKAEVKAKPAKKADAVSTFSAGEVLRNPRITEKAAYASDKNVYTFDIAPRASKVEVVKAVKEIYKVTPIKVNVSAIPKKRVFRKNSVGVKGGGKKAYVFLKKGDKIEFV
jgi:large subunit ribosomal protein L23